MPTAIDIGNLLTGGTGSTNPAAERGGGSPSPPPTQPFTFIVNVADNPATGSSTGIGNYRLPLSNTGTYNFTVDWGDGSTDTITTYNQAEATHSYSLPYDATYTIKITGTCEKFNPSVLTDAGKLRDVTFWGGGTNLLLNADFCWRLAVGNGTNGLIPTAFSATDAVKLSGQNRGIFFTSTGVTKGVSGWDTSSATNLQYFAFNASRFNDDISGWDVSNITNLGIAFQGTAMTQANYDALLISWSAQTVQNNVSFAISAQYTAGGAAEAGRNILINTYNWTITDGGAN